MKYSVFGGLLWLAMLSVQCSPGPTPPAEPAETPRATPLLPPTPTLPVDTSTPLLPTSMETPGPSATPVQTLSLPETITPASTAAQTPAAGEAQLKMVVIRAKSQAEIKQLRQMGLNIIRIRTVESKETPESKEDFLVGEFIIEAVVPPGLLAKLKTLGFEVTVVP